MKFFGIFLFLFLCAMSFASARGAMGGFGDFSPATVDEQMVLDSVRKSVETQLDRHFPQFHAVSFTTQIVAGINYIIVVDTGDEVLHVKIAKPLPYTKQDPFLMSVRRGVTLDTPIDPQLM